jgi:hypothetical protein
MKIMLVVAALLVGGPAFAGDFQYVVCVSTVDHAALRFDSQYTNDHPAAVARVASILAQGWETDGDVPGQRDHYPASSVVKVRLIDMQLDGGARESERASSECLPN